MTVREAIEHLRDMYKSDNPFMHGRRIEIEVAIKSLKKQIPKEVVKKIEFSSYEYISYRCPICNRHFLSKIEGDFVAGTKPKYCYDCGQALDWGEDSE